MSTYSVKARRIDGGGSVATTRAAEVILDTSLSGREDAFNPAELFLASIAACIIKGVERVTPLLEFDLRGVEVKLTANRRDRPPKLVSVGYEIIVATDESDHRLELLHTNVRKFGTIFNTVSEATKLTGVLRRKQADSPGEAAEHQAEIERIAESSRKQLDAIPAPGTDVLHEGP
ncbi:MAG TPA: OsmC family protein [Allosphingosinicella sp.]|nr:OsmC family protein [Allosphingosinicella sp.]